MQEYIEIPAFLRDFLINMEVIQGKSKKTTYEYYLDLRSFLRFVKCKLNKASFEEFDSLSVADITIEDLEKITLNDLYEYMYYLSSQRDNKSNSRARKVSSLRSFYKYLTTKVHLLKDNPAKELDMPKMPSLLPKHLSLDESIALLSAVKGENAKRDYAILTLFLNCGLRLSELVGINITDYRGDKLTVIGKGNRERTIYLNDACKKALDDYLAERPHDGVKDRNALFLSRFKQRISTKMVQVIVKNTLKNANLDSEKYSVHKLRHTAATLMYKHGDVDIRALQEILGHRQLSTTQIYTHVDDDTLRDAIAHNPLSKITKD